MANPTTGQPVIPSTGPTLHATGEVVPRSVDLGREEHLVTWGEWFERSRAAMDSVLPEELRDGLLFRATLGDGRQFLVREIRQHISHGACTIEKTRWHERDAICDVITGYLLIGHDERGVPTTVAVMPDEILTVECVLAMVGSPEEEAPEEKEKKLFGFAQFAQALKKRRAGVEEVEETRGRKNDEDDDAGEGVSA